MVSCGRGVLGIWDLSVRAYHAHFRNEVAFEHPKKYCMYFSLSPRKLHVDMTSACARVFLHMWKSVQIMRKSWIAHVCVGYNQTPAP